MVVQLNTDLGNGWKAMRATMRDRATIPLFLVELTGPTGYPHQLRLDLGKRRFLDKLPKIDMALWHELVANAIIRECGNKP